MTTDVVAKKRSESSAVKRKNVDVPNASAIVKRSYSKESSDGLVNVTKITVGGAAPDIITSRTLTVLCAT